MLRLHRPVHTLVDVGAANVPFHRAITVQAARTLLDMRRIARVSHTNALAGTFFVAAAVSLAIDVLQLPPGPARTTVEALEMRAEVEQLMVEFLDGAKMPVMQRGKRVLEFLLGQIDGSQVRRPVSSIAVGLTRRLSRRPRSRERTPCRRTREKTCDMSMDLTRRTPAAFEFASELR